MKRAAVFCAAVFMLLLLCGCVDATVDELYSLPKTQEEFQQLQALIENEILAGSEYLAPNAGTKRPSVQLVDLNGDSVNEAVAFLKNPSSTPMICVYRVESGQYELATTITGEGSAIGRVEYEDLDGDGVLEIVVAWKMSADLAAVKAYSMRDWVATVLLSVSCTDFRVDDFGSIGESAAKGTEVIVLSMGDEGGLVDVYFADRTGELTKVSASLSASLTAAERFRITSLPDGAPAVFVEGSFKEDETSYYIADVLAFTGGELKNITLDPDTGNSIAKQPSTTSAYCTDIDGDGCLDLAFSEKVYNQNKSATDYYVFDWYSFSSDGEHIICASTYHSYSDGWFLVIPEGWREGFTVRRETVRTGERTVVISTVNEKTLAVTDRLTIFTLSGENREDRASLPGRFTLIHGEATIYAAFLTTEDGEGATEQQIRELTDRFHIIYSEWTTGAV